MFNIGDTVLYGKEGVCCVERLENKNFGGEIRSYYVLKSLDRVNSVIFVPADNQKLVASIRKVLSANEINELIKKINTSEAVWEENDVLRREEYHRIIADADCLALGINLRILHNKKEELKISGKKFRRFDEEFFIQAQNLLFNEFAHVLKISKNDVLTYILEYGKDE